MSYHPHAGLTRVHISTYLPRPFRLTSSRELLCDYDRDRPPGSGFAIGIAVWFLLQTIGSFYAGGRVAGFFARSVDPRWSSVHAFAVWGFPTTIIVYGLSNASGAALNGTLNASRFGLGIAVSSAQAIGPATGGGAGSAALNGIGAVAATASPGTVAVATWIPIYLFIVFGLSCFTATLGARSAVIQRIPEQV
jgi:hypothetical protein